MSLAALAKRANYSKGHLANVENGRKRATPDVVLAYECALRDSGRRRPHLPSATVANAVAPMVMSDVLQEAFAAALRPMVSIDEWRERVQTYGLDYMMLGAGELCGRLVADLAHLQQCVHDPQAWAPAANLMTVYGKTLSANDGRKSAIRWYRLAARAADQSGDMPTQVWVRARAALALAYEGAELATAKRLALQGLALSSQPSMGQLNATLALAHCTSMQTGDAPAAEKALDTARKLYETIATHDGDSDFAMPPWRFASHESMLYSRLGLVNRACDAQERANRLRPQRFHRFSTHIQLHHALMLAQSGDRKTGLECAQNAMAQLPARKHSLSLRLMFQEVVHAATAQTR